jgi:serine/threonine-protein kinase HipA
VEEFKDFHQKCSRQFFGIAIPPRLYYTLNQMGELAMRVVERSIAIPGVQPKLSMSLINEAISGAESRMTVVGALGGNFILKPPSDRFPEMPENEHLTMRIAQAFGVPVLPSSLMRLSSGELSYVTKRIDRNESGEKIHMIDMFQITEAFDKYKGSLEKVGKTIGKYSDNTLLDKVIFFDLTLFSFLTGNNDMHLKNFSMIESASGWILSPAYDLLNVAIVFPEDQEELALTLVGKKRKLKQEHFTQLGIELDLTPRQINGAYNRMKRNKEKGLKWIEKSFLSKEMKEFYRKTLESRYNQLDLHG